MTPFLTNWAGSRSCIYSLLKDTDPFVTSPLSEASKLEIDFKVVLFPAPLPPSKAVMPPFLTFKLTPFKTRITWL